MSSGEGGSYCRGNRSKFGADNESEVDFGVNSSIQIAVTVCVNSSIQIAATAVGQEPIAMNVCGGTNSWQSCKFNVNSIIINHNGIAS
jgi:hypothetical protein